MDYFPSGNNMGLSSPAPFICGVQDYWSINPPQPLHLLPPPPPTLVIEDDHHNHHLHNDFSYGLQTFQQQLQQPLPLPPPPPPPLQFQPQNYTTAGVFDSNTNNNNYYGVYASSSSSSSSDIVFQMAMDAQLELHKQELDFILQSQSEKLRLVLHEQSKQQLSVLMSSFESKMMSLIRQKEEDMVRVRIKSEELHDELKNVEIENQTWERVAIGTDSTVVDLRNTLAYFKGRNKALNVNNNNNHNLVEDTGSCCEGSVLYKNDQKFVCHSCKTQSLCVLFFPCRHLCSCKSCETSLVSCPVCETNKEAAMEVFFV
ncbi:probable BOI-related E3 ubiquitin-protein ligase 2 [Cannabis sativa]|uniref:RING-type domain-containing protein n=2 Tax=Cannabis sativa TaxID=3483 RepID=A0A7J6EC64_CANSA|nr:probable BOI-related E3 ubiquitin-protein ligase 2 [Cannabis sativa]KAF4355894.1 hypothetical protein G4B88_011618 [Cannabis sativa]KAF4388470.1 hypothetical protein F8388_012447 [Cannabis sativa]